MSVLDWVDVNAMATGAAPWSWFAGKFGSTTGDTIGGYVGSRAAHIIGPDYKVVCDLEDLLTQIPVVGNLLEAVSPILGGLGGNVSFTYGANSGLTYFGPQAVVRRAPKWEKTADSVLGKAKFRGPGGHHDKDDVTDTAVDVAVGALSLVMVGVAAGLHIAARIEYGKMASAEAKAAEEETEEAEKEAAETEEKAEEKLELYALLLKLITPRVMSFIKMLEEACTIGHFGKEFVKMLWPILLSLSIAAVPMFFLVTLAEVPFALLGSLTNTISQDQFAQAIEWQAEAVGRAIKYSVEVLAEAAAGE